MTAKNQLIREIEQVSDALAEEVLDFLLFAKNRRNLQNPLPNTTLQNPEAPSQEDRPIWDLADEIIASIPESVLNQLPTDGATQHDHYLYGTPKREA